MNSIASSGVLLGSRFALERRIALGGMGEVWAATDQVLERHVAVKVLRRDLVDSDDFLTRFRTEARLAAGLSHPGIAHVYDYAEDVADGERVAFLVMELVDGQPLSARMGRPGRSDVREIVSILGQTAEALGAAHAVGIVHRDVKPGNLLVTADGRVKVTDFGIARAINAASVTEVGEVIGTVRYMSPEQALGEEATPASDVYSLAVVGFEMLSGRPPFTADSPAAIALAHVQSEPPALPAWVPGGLRSLIERSLAKVPEQRPSDGAAFADALHEITVEPTAVLPTAVVLPQATTTPGDATGDTDRSAVTEIAPTLPPLAATSLLGDGWVDAQRRRRRRVATWGALAAAAICVLVLIALDQTGDFSDASAAASTVPRTTVAVPVAAGELVTMNPATYLGLTEADARAALSAAGLIAATTTGPSAADLTGLVIDVQPSGAVPVGSTVTIVLGDGTVAPAPTQPAGGAGNGNGPNDQDDDKDDKDDGGGGGGKGKD